MNKTHQALKRRKMFQLKCSYCGETVERSCDYHKILACWLCKKDRHLKRARMKEALTKLK